MSNDRCAGTAGPGRDDRTAQTCRGLPEQTAGTRGSGRVLGDTRGMHDADLPAGSAAPAGGPLDAAAGPRDPNDPLFDRRPWGSFQVLDEAGTYKVKRITVDPGQRLSYQFHHRRAEHWVIVTGRAEVTLDDEVLPYEAGQVVEVGRGVRHRIRNPGDEVLTFVEVQTGDYFGEDDIVRLDDDYGRRDPA